MRRDAGTRLGPYEVVALIGEGGMGQVYRAIDTRLDRTVALKTLPAHVHDQPERRDRFEREARAIAILNHPNICTLHDIGRGRPQPADEDREIDFLVMEHVEGETLAARLTRTLPLGLALPDVFSHGTQIADALDHAHPQGIVHRDLKPGNVMITRSGVKLLDFGLAKILPSAADSSKSMLSTQLADLTTQGTIIGTLQYMAPEQVEGRDARTDIFALGAVLHECATGEKAFAGRSQASVIAAILKSDPPPISSRQTRAGVARSRRGHLPGEGSRRSMANGARPWSRLPLDRRGGRRRAHGSARTHPHRRAHSMAAHGCRTRDWRGDRRRRCLAVFSRPPCLPCGAKHNSRSTCPPP